MSTGQIAGAYINQAKSAIRPARRIRRKEMKLSLKQRFRDWLMDTDREAEADRNIYVEEDKLSSEGMRLQIYKASGGFVVETRSYDRRTDRNQNTMHVVRDDQDLGEALGKIITMEAMR